MSPLGITSRGHTNVDRVEIESRRPRNDAQAYVCTDLHQLEIYWRLQRLGLQCCGVRHSVRAKETIYAELLGVGVVLEVTPVAETTTLHGKPCVISAQTHDTYTAKQHTP
jgi:hypothetical protein